MRKYVLISFLSLNFIGCIDDYDHDFFKDNEANINDKSQLQLNYQMKEEIGDTIVADDNPKLEEGDPPKDSPGNTKK